METLIIYGILNCKCLLFVLDYNKVFVKTYNATLGMIIFMLIPGHALTLISAQHGSMLKLKMKSLILRPSQN